MGVGWVGGWVGKASTNLVQHDKIAPATRSISHGRFGTQVEFSRWRPARVIARTQAHQAAVKLLEDTHIPIARPPPATQSEQSTSSESRVAIRLSGKGIRRDVQGLLLACKTHVDKLSLGGAGELSVRCS